MESGRRAAEAPHEHSPDKELQVQPCGSASVREKRDFFRFLVFWTLTTSKQLLRRHVPLKSPLDRKLHFFVVVLRHVCLKRNPSALPQLLQLHFPSLPHFVRLFFYYYYIFVALCLFPSLVFKVDSRSFTDGVTCKSIDKCVFACAHEGVSVGECVRSVNAMFGAGGGEKNRSPGSP